MTKTVFDVLNLIHPRPPELLQPDRFFIYEGELETLDETTKRKKRRHLFLFNDLLLITKREGAKRYWLRIYANLRNNYVHIEDVRQSFAFKLVARTRTFTFYPTSQGEKETWMVLLNGSISALCEKEPKNARGERIPQDAPSISSQSGGGWSKATPSAPEDTFDESALSPKSIEKRQTFNFLDFDDVPTSVPSTLPPVAPFAVDFNQPVYVQPVHSNAPPANSFQNQHQQFGNQQQGNNFQNVDLSFGNQQQPYGFQPQYQGYGQPQGYVQQGPPPSNPYNPFLDPPHDSPTPVDQRPVRPSSYNPFLDDPNTNAGQPSFQP